MGSSLVMTIAVGVSVTDTLHQIFLGLQLESDALQWISDRPTKPKKNEKAFL